MNSTDLQYTIRGYQYRTYLDIEEDNQKIFHYCYRDGKQIDMPREFYNHSPYSYIEPAEFEKQLQTVEVFVQG
jgi:hypothetical protein